MSGKCNCLYNKKIISSFFSRALYSRLPFWAFHIVLFSAAVVVFLCSPRSINTDFMALLPMGGVNSEMRAAEKAFMGSRNNTVNFIIESSDSQKARSVAERIRNYFEGSGLFKTSLGKSFVYDAGELTSYITDNVYLFLNKDIQDYILQNPEDFKEDRLSYAFSAFSPVGMETLEKDPFMLSSLVMTSLLEKASNFSNARYDDGFLCAEADGKSYIVLSGELTSGNELKMRSRQKGGLGKPETLESVFEIARVINGEESGARVYLSGTPLHTAESSSNARREVAAISGLSVVLILLLFFFAFRNFYILKPFLLSLFLSLLSGASVLVIFFKEIHILTLIFGTSLIGTCIDYSVHFFVSFIRTASHGDGETGTEVPAEARGKATGSGVPAEARGKTAGRQEMPAEAQGKAAESGAPAGKRKWKTSYEARDAILKSLWVGFLSTFACYILLIFSSYEVLRQIALFCAFGLLSSFIVSVFLFPRISSRRMVSEKSPILGKKRGDASGVEEVFGARLGEGGKSAFGVRFEDGGKRMCTASPIYFVCFVLLVLFAVFLPKIRIHNDIGSLYTPSAGLLEGERVFSRVMGYEDVSYALVSGANLEEALEREHEFAERTKGIADILCITAFYPPPSEQRRSIAASRALIPYVYEMCETLALDEDASDNVRKKIETAEVRTEISELLSPFNLGKKGDNYYLAVILRDVKDSVAAEEASQAVGGVYYIQTAREISARLTVLTQKILFLFSAGFGIIIVVLLLTYGMKKGFLMVAALTSVVLAAALLCVAMGGEIDFFFVTGEILVMGLGLDYIVFMADGVKNKRAPSDADKSDPASCKEAHCGRREDTAHCGEARPGQKSAFPSVFLSFVSTELSFGILALSSFKPVRIFGFTVFSGILFAFLCAILVRRRDEKA